MFNYLFSNRYIYYLIFFIIFVQVSTCAQAQDVRYRVEILVLSHLDQNETPREMKWINDYSESLDFLTPPPPVEEAGEDSMAQDAAGTAETAAETPAEFDQEVENPEELAEKDPNAVVHIEEMSENMQEAWRRLRLSAPFRPEQFLSWEQGSSEPFPSLRVHDLVVVKTDDPYADLRQALEDEALEDNPAMEQPQVFADAAGLNALQDGTEDEAQAELPDPNVFYRLDGSVKLIRTRFLHLELDLQLRDAVYQEPEPFSAPGSLLATRPQETSPAADALSKDENPPPREPVSFLIHPLTQSRQVKTERMEYFDGPVIGVLAYITAIQVEDAETP
jgi:hypothetical protein